MSCCIEPDLSLCRSGPCCPDIMAETPEALAARTSAIKIASAIIQRLTGMQFSRTCAPITVRPCFTESCCNTSLADMVYGPRKGQGSGNLGVLDFEPMLIGGEVYNVGCNLCGDGCCTCCNADCRVKLPGPVCEIVDVVVGDTHLGKNAYDLYADGTLAFRGNGVKKIDPIKFPLPTGYENVNDEPLSNAGCGVSLDNIGANYIFELDEKKQDLQFVVELPLGFNSFSVFQPQQFDVIVLAGGNPTITLGPGSLVTVGPPTIPDTRVKLLIRAPKNADTKTISITQQSNDQPISLCQVEWTDYSAAECGVDQGTYIEATEGSPEIPAIPEQPFVPANPGQPFIPADPGQPFIPATPDIPATPGSPEIPPVFGTEDNIADDLGTFLAFNAIDPDGLVICQAVAPATPPFGMIQTLDPTPPFCYENDPLDNTSQRYFPGVGCQTWTVTLPAGSNSPMAWFSNIGQWLFLGAPTLVVGGPFLASEYDANDVRMRLRLVSGPANLPINVNGAQVALSEGAWTFEACFDRLDRDVILVPGVPAVPPTPFIPGNPGQPFIPATPGQPFIPATPEIPFSPAVPGVPAVPATPASVLYDRVSDSCCPGCQDYNKPLGEEGTWSVTYRVGREVPEEINLAAGLLACEYGKLFLNDSNCTLPQRVKNVARPGMNVEMFDPLAFTNQGLTGLVVVDELIKAWNPHGLRQPSQVWYPGMNKIRRIIQ